MEEPALIRQGRGFGRAEFRGCAPRTPPGWVLVFVDPGPDSAELVEPLVSAAASAGIEAIAAPIPSAIASPQTRPIDRKCAELPQRGEAARRFAPIAPPSQGIEVVAELSTRGQAFIS